MITDNVTDLLSFVSNIGLDKMVPYTLVRPVWQNF